MKTLVTSMHIPYLTQRMNYFRLSCMSTSFVLADGLKERAF